MYIYIYTYVVYIYIYREREREIMLHIADIPRAAARAPGSAPTPQLAKPHGQFS